MKKYYRISRSGLGTKTIHIYTPLCADDLMPLDGNTIKMVLKRLMFRTTPPSKEKTTKICQLMDFLPLTGKKQL